MTRQPEIIVGLDVGTTKVCAIVGEIGPEGQVDITGIGSSPSHGLRRGVVINIESTMESIRRAIEEAELMAGCEINDVFAGIAGGHIEGMKSDGMVTLKHKEVREADIVRVIDSAKAVGIPLDRDVLHILPQEYIIDDQDGIKEPLGMSGLRLATRVYIVTAAVAAAQNIIRSAQKCGINSRDIVLEQLASSYSVLSQDEKELGVVLVDIGGGTSDIAIWVDGSIVHTSVLTVAGSHITNDIALGLRTPMDEAERIKQKYGCAIANMVDQNETIEVPSVGGREPRMMSRRFLCEIIEPRVEEIFSLVQHEIRKTGYEDLLASGLVVAGGAALMSGMVELAEEVVELPTRVGYPQGVGGLMDVVKNPMYATGVGLVLYGVDHADHRYFRVRDTDIYGTVRSRMKSWLGELFGV